MHHYKIFLFILLFLCGYPSLGYSALGEKDPSYGANIFGTQGPTALATAFQPDGKLIVGGNFSAVDGTDTSYLARLNPDGSIDRSFLADVYELSILPYSAAVLDDGRLLIGGADAFLPIDENLPLLARLNADGSTDASFPTVITGGTIHCLAVQADGKVLVGGSFKKVNQTHRSYLVRLNADGSLDDSFAPVVNNIVRTLACQADGKILAGGLFEVPVSGTPQSGLVRLNPDGSIDDKFVVSLKLTNGAGAAVTAINLFHNGHMAVAGSFQSVNGLSQSGLVLLTENGNPLSTLTENTNASSLATQCNGAFLISSSYSVNSTVLGVLKRDQNHRDLSFNPELGYAARAIVLQKDGSPITSITPSQPGSQAKNIISRLKNTPATENLTVSGGDRIIWDRGGSAPALTHCHFDHSEDGGNTWQRLGEGTATAEGWELVAETLPSSGHIRARGRHSGGFYNGSSSLIESSINLSGHVPSIALKGPSENDLPVNGATFSFGNKTHVVKTFRIKNEGVAPLIVHQVRLASIESFSINTTSLPTLLPPGAEGSFEVKFTPRVNGELQTQIQILSNDPITPERLVQLTGSSLGNSEATLSALWGFSTALSSDTIFPFPHLMPGRTIHHLSFPSNAREVAIGLQTPQGSTVTFIGDQPLDQRDLYSYKEYHFLFEGSLQVHPLDVTSPDQSRTQRYLIYLHRLPAKPGEADLSFVGPPTGYSPPIVSTLLLTPDQKLRAALYTNSDTLPSGFYEFDSTGVPTQLLAGLAGTQPPFTVLPNHNGQILGSGWSSAPAPFQRSIASMGQFDGTWNSTFKSQGISGSTSGHHVLLDGKILMQSSVTQGYRLAETGHPIGILIRLNQDGSLDPSFECPRFSSISTFAVESDGHIIVSGQYSMAPFSNQRLFRLNQNGSFAMNQPPHQPDAPPLLIAAAPEGQWIVAGDFTSIHGSMQRRIARFKADWQVDLDFDAQPPLLSGSIRSLAVQANGDIVAVDANSFNDPTGAFNTSTNVFKLSSNGAYLSDFRHDLTGVAKEITLLKDGKVLIAGQFTAVNALDRFGLARLINDPATEQINVSSASRIQWLRGGSSPEAQRVFFQVSVDEGLTWTHVKEALRIIGGWEVTGVALPQRGQIRGCAVIGAHAFLSKSAGLLHSDIVSFDFAAPEIAVSLENTDLISGTSEVSFTETALKTGTRQKKLVLTNLGGTALKDIRFLITGSDASAFRLHAPAPTTLLPGEQVEVTIEFAPNLSGVYMALLEIASNAQTLPTFSLSLNGTGTKVAPPTVTTSPAEDVTHESARLLGTFAAFTPGQRIWLEYGLTSKMGTSISIPVPEDSESDSAFPITTTLTGLQSHTRYYYRLHTDGPLGKATGKSLSFTTLNRSPEGEADSYTILRGCVIAMNPLSNDWDVDGDSLSIHSVTSLTPTTAGKVIKSGSQVTITLSPNAPAKTTFSYRVADRFGGVSESINVEISATSPLSDWSLIPSLSANEQTLSLELPPGTLWNLASWPKWIIPHEKLGMGPIQLRVLANASKSARSGVIKVGDFSCLLTQAEGSLPSIRVQQDVPIAIIGDSYHLNILVDNGPVKFSAKNLPPGLILKADGSLTGRPTTVGEYLIEVQASNIFGRSPDVLAFTVRVEPFDERLTGMFEGFFVARDSDSVQLTGRYQWLVQKSGAYTGKLQFGARSLPFKGYVDTVGAGGVVTIPLDRTITFADQAEIRFSPESGPTFTLRQESTDIPLFTQSQSIPWNGTDRQATDYQGLHTFIIMPPTALAAAPTGYGFVLANVIAKTGVTRLIGRLADGSAFTASSSLGTPQGTPDSADLTVYSPLYRNDGYYAGNIKIVSSTATSDYQVKGSGYWHRPASKSRLHPEGFSRLVCSVQGGALPAVAPGGLILGATPGSGNARLTITEGGAEPKESLSVTLTNPRATGSTQKATVASGPTITATLTKIDAKTGSLGGQLTLSGTTKALNRKVSFVGLIVRTFTGTAGYGQFLMPSIPGENQTLKTTPIRAGKVLLEASP